MGLSIIKDPNSVVEFVEYRVRPVTRYIVTQHERRSDLSGSVREVGNEYADPNVAHEVAYALCRQRHDSLGWPVGDERIVYPALPPQPA